MVVGVAKGPMFRNLRFRNCVMSATIAMFVTASCEAAHMKSVRGDRSLYSIIDALVAAPKLDRATVERITGVPLSPVPDANATFDNFEGHGLQLNEVAIERVDYRAPAAGSEVTVGPRLSIELTGKCITQKEIFAKYKHLKIVDQPRGTPVARPSTAPLTAPPEIAEEQAFSKHYPWGELTFGFAGSSDCLKDVGLAIRSRRGK